MKSYGEQTPPVTKFWKFASRVLAYVPAALLIDLCVTSMFNVRPMYGVVELRPLLIILLLIGGFCGYLPIRPHAALLSISLCWMLLVFSPYLGLLSFTDSYYSKHGHLVVADEGLFPSSTGVYVFGKLPWSPTVYEGLTGLPGYDLEEMNDADYPALDRIIVGDGVYWKSE